MPKITHIKQQQKRTELYSVFVDGKFAFSFDQTGLLDNQLKIGREISDAELAELKKKSDENKIFLLAYKKALNRPHSVFEISQYLRKKQLEDEAAQQIIDKLKRFNVLEDAAFADFMVRHLSGKHSKREIKAKLLAKRVDPKIIDDKLAEADDADSLKKLIDKKSKVSRYQDEKKLVQFLLRKGYAYGDIKAALEKRADSDQS